MIQIETIEQLEDFLANNSNSIILKHSTLCSISAGAYREFSSFEENSPVPLAVVFIIDTRSVSNYLTEVTGIDHKSPQALFFCQGKCYDDLSHYEITGDNMQAILEDKR